MLDRLRRCVGRRAVAIIALGLAATITAKVVSGYGAGYGVTRAMFWLATSWEAGLLVAVLLPGARKVGLWALLLTSALGLLWVLSQSDMPHCGCLGDWLIGRRTRVSLLSLAGFLSCTALLHERSKASAAAHR